LDKASPALFLACANGKHLSSAVLTVRKAGKGQQEYLVLKLTDVMVSSYQTSGSANEAEAPIDKPLSAPQRSRSSTARRRRTYPSARRFKAGWDVLKNAKF
jgi:hypothetical protein